MPETRLSYNPDDVIAKLSAQLAAALAQNAKLEAVLERLQTEGTES